MPLPFNYKKIPLWPHFNKTFRQPWIESSYRSVIHIPRVSSRNFSNTFLLGHFFIFYIREYKVRNIEECRTSLLLTYWKKPSCSHLQKTTKEWECSAEIIPGLPHFMLRKCAENYLDFPPPWGISAIVSGNVEWKGTSCLERQQGRLSINR